MLIAEIGINHNGRVDEAKNLVSAAKAAGCNAIKFQYRNKDFYQEKNQIGDEILFGELERTHIDLPQLSKIFLYAKKLQLNIGVSFFRTQDFDEFILHQKVDFYKVPSAEHDNIELIDKLLNTGKEVFISTGGADLQKLPRVLGEKRIKHLNVMHCIANYPVALGQEKFDVFALLKKQNWKSVGYSSHDENYLTCLVALGLGIDSLERHIVIDKYDGGLDSSSSSDFEEFVIIGNFSRNFLGNNKIDPNYIPEMVHRNQGEVMNMQNLGTGLYAKESLKTGTKVSLKNFDVKAPRIGVSAGFLSNSDNSNILKKDIIKGEPLTHSILVEKTNFDFTEKDETYFHEKRIGLPVRVHDWLQLKNYFSLNTFEFHLSFGEVLNTNFGSIIKNITEENYYAIHLPDYISQHSLIDLFSKEKEVVALSESIIKKVLHFSSLIEQKTGVIVPIVGSFPFSQKSPERFIENLGNKLIDLGGEKILPQWLPVHGWYFGGHSKIETFNSPEFVQAIIKKEMNICLDISHLIMSANFYSKPWYEWYSNLLPYTKHIHLSDAAGIDGEGLKFGEGDLKKSQLKIPQNCLTILEVWQGHLNDFAGFSEALKYTAQKRLIS